MKRNARSDIDRRMKIISLLQDDAQSIQDLIKNLPGRPSKSVVDHDLNWIKKTFPKQVVSENTKGRQGDTSRRVHRWIGDAPIALENPPRWLNPLELTALIAARGLLRQGDPKRSAINPVLGEKDILAGAVHGLLGRIKVVENVEHLERNVVSVSKFGAEPLDPLTLTACLKATTEGRSIRFTYTSLEGSMNPHAHATPQRLILIRGEWYCFAWAGSLRMFKMARMASVVPTDEPAPNLPTHITAQEVDAFFATSFFATGGTDPKSRRTIKLAVSPGAWPFIRDRRWGDSQNSEETPTDLPQGWRRLTFTTSGLHECVHWILSFGSGIIPEGPQELIDRIADETQAMLDNLKKKRSK